MQITRFFLSRFGLFPPNALASELLLRADPRADLLDRTYWLTSLLAWLKGDGDTISPRLRYLWQLLEKNPEWKVRVGATLRSVIRDAPALRLFLQTGFALETGLWSELTRRFMARFLPTMAEHDLLEILLQSGWGSNEAAWLENLSPELLAPLVELIQAGPDEEPPEVPLRKSARAALLLLSSSVNHFGLSREVRDRHQLKAIELSPFLLLQKLVLELVNLSGGLPSSEDDFRAWDAALGSCRQALRAVYLDMEHSGVSVSLVYRLEVISASLQRMDDLILAFAPRREPLKPVPFTALFGKLIRTSEDCGSIRDHLRSHLYLLSRKIAERNGHSGEHYLAQNRKELTTLFFSGIGGGIVVVLMAIGQILQHRLHLPPVLTATVSWLIYSAGFLLMQFAGLTLATKLPSFLAAHLARSLGKAGQAGSSGNIRAEIQLSFGSQIIGFVGNLAGVIPFGLFLSWALYSAFGVTLFSPEEGLATVQEVHPWKSFAVLLGALTGVELWLSSLAGGWFENWLVFRRVPEAIRKHPALRRVLGDQRASAFGDLLEHNSSGFAANVSLGFLFGFVPLAGLFIGFSTESRHVTIASTRTLLGFASFNWQEHEGSLIAVSIAGLACVGIMNFFVSFLLALSVATRATGAKSVWSMSRRK